MQQQLASQGLEGRLKALEEMMSVHLAAHAVAEEEDGYEEAREWNRGRAGAERDRLLEATVHHLEDQVNNARR